MIPKIWIGIRPPQSCPASIPSTDAARMVGPAHGIRFNTPIARTATRRSVDGLMCIFVDRKHGRNNDQEGGCTAAVQMTDQGNNRCHDGHTDHIVTDILHQLVDDDIKHAGIRHDSEEQDREHKQGCGRAGALIRP